ncbi:S-layer homology domain-containing protein [Paenibacillus odorifer]|uniref:SLH domain-containing protein n=1 Tax=Paenibacillus odorifer TaxID=189426 RepID=A0A1R0Y9V6_9BACL|nr:S-layer homology domain-containing protein [Paenibacillus odorifer]OMD44185.1 hypothetical protein BSK52_01205 [Paenibacillus odorifer]
MGRKFRGILAGALGVSMLFSSLGVVTAQNSKDYEGHWAQKAIDSWLDSGKLKGFEDGSVKPNQTITRAEFMTLVNRAFNYTKLAKISYDDVPSTNWAYNEIARAVEAGYIQGFNNEMRPNAPINRQEAAVIISRLLKLEGGSVDELKVFSDAGQIAAWSKESVASAVKAGVLKGYPNGTFAPGQALTRAESLTLIDSAEALTHIVLPTASPVTTSLPSVAPTATATAASAGGGSGGGGGGGAGGAGGAGGGQSEATSTPTATPTPTASPTSTPEPTMPIKELPALDIHITSTPNESVTNSVYLKVDFSKVFDTIVNQNDQITYYITSEPINDRDLRWGLTNLNSYITMSGYTARLMPEITVSSSYIDGGGDGEKYVSVVVRNHKEEITGYYTQKMNLKFSQTEQASDMVKLESGVTITQEKFIYDGWINPGEYYSDIIDVTNAFAQLNGNAVSYTIYPKYYKDLDQNPQLNDSISASRTLYKSNRIRVVETTYSSGGATSPGYIPIVYESYYNYKTYNEAEYMIVFYDTNLKAIAYYKGKVQLSDELAVEAAEKRIDDIPISLGLKEEDTINRASRAYEALNESLRGRISEQRKVKLMNAQETLEILKKSGPLQNLALVSSYIGIREFHLNGTLVNAYTIDFPDTLRREIGSFSYYITKNPITGNDLEAPSIYGKYAFSEINKILLPIRDKIGDYNVTIVYYDKADKPLRYTTKQMNFSALSPAWDNSAVQVLDGVTMERHYGNGGRVDFIDVQNYVRAHREAVYFTVTSRSMLEKEQAFTVENVVKNLNQVYQGMAVFNSSDPALNGQTEEYIVIFYDKDYKAISYYTGVLKD